MPGGWWDYIHIHRPEDDTASPGHNLQDGLFQIASQTCSLLVQVNNTNNISYGGNSSNVTYNQFGHQTRTSSSSGNPTSPEPSTSRSREVHVTIPSKGSSLVRTNSKLDREQSVDLLSKREKLVKRNSNLFSNYKHRLSVSTMRVVYCVGLKSEDIRSQRGRHV